MYESRNWQLKKRDHVTHMYSSSDETDFTTDSSPETDPYYIAPGRMSVPTQLYEERERRGGRHWLLQRQLITWARVCADCAKSRRKKSGTDAL